MRLCRNYLWVFMVCLAPWFGARARSTFASEPLPGTAVYRNDQNPVSLSSAPGVGIFLADDLSLTHPFGCELSGYELMVTGREGGTFDVTVELWDSDPCAGGAEIQGTRGTWTGLPADRTLHLLQKTVTTPLGIPGTVWMRVSFSSNFGGWVIAGQAEIGTTENLFAVDRPEANDCRHFFFGPGPPLPYAGFWAAIHCQLEPPAMGPCCQSTTCLITTEAACGGIWRGPGSNCTPNPCGEELVVFENNFITGTFLPLAQGTRVGDDLLTSSGTTPCHLSRYELAVTGRSGTAPFSVLTELWSNGLGADGEISEDDIPLAPIPGTAAAFLGIRADQITQRLGAGPFPAGMVLPEKVWVVASTSTPDSGPITAGLADVGTSIDGYAVESQGRWMTGLNFGGFRPEGCPGGTTCVPAGSFRVRLFCYGESADGACCDAVTDRCTDERTIRQCQGRSFPNMTCDENPFEPSCGAATCPIGEVVFIDPPHGVVDAGQPHSPDQVTPHEGIQSFLVEAPPRANGACFSACETGDAPANPVSEVIEEAPGLYRVSLSRPLSAGSLTHLFYAGTEAVGTFVAHPGNVNADGIVGVLDVFSLIGCLNGNNPETACPWGSPFSNDLNRDGATNPGDLLRLIDLLNGAGALDSASDSPLPSGTCR